MPMNASLVPEDGLLVLLFEGNLDLTVTNEVLGIVPQFCNGLKTCIMDLTEVDRIFDSGIALLRMLSGELHRAGATVVVLTDHSDERRRLSWIQGDATYPSRRHFMAASCATDGMSGWSRSPGPGLTPDAGGLRPARSRTDLAGA